MQTKTRIKKRQTRIEKRVAIARDVLKHLAEMKVGRREYIRGKVQGAKSEDDVQKHADAITEKCQVCALGACFISMGRLYNDTPIGSMIPPYWGEGQLKAIREEILLPLIRYFPISQLREIETAFEQSVDIGQGSPAAKQWGQKYKEDKERLAAIMRNIIRNKGEFVVPKLKKYGVKK